MADVRHTFEVERPARLLVEMGTRELPQDGSIHQGAPFPRPRGRGIHLQSCKLSLTGLSIEMRSRHFSRRPDLQLFTLLAGSGSDTRSCRWPWTSQRSPLIGPATTTELSSKAAERFFALTPPLERDPLLFFDT